MIDSNFYTSRNGILVPADSELARDSGRITGLARDYGRTAGKVVNATKNLASKIPVSALTGAGVGVLGALEYADTIANNQKYNQDIYRNAVTTEDSEFDPYALQQNVLDAYNKLHPKVNPNGSITTNEASDTNVGNAVVASNNAGTNSTPSSGTPTAPTSTATTPTTSSSTAASTTSTATTAVPASAPKARSRSNARKASSVSVQSAPHISAMDTPKVGLIATPPALNTQNYDNNANNNNSSGINFGNLLSNLDGLLPLLMAGYFGYTLGK